MEEAKLPLAAQNRTDWSAHLSLKMNQIKRQLSDVESSVELARELAKEGALLDRWGSRSLAWQIFLGLLPSRPTGQAPLKVEWVQRVRAQRANWNKLEESLSIKAMMQQNKFFNPLAPPPTNTQDNKAQ